MPDPFEEQQSIEALLSETAGAILRAQRALDDKAASTLAESETGTRFWLNSIPTVEVAWKLSLVTSKNKKLFFIPRGRKTDRLLHVVSLTFNAVPNPPDPLTQSVPLESEPLPLVLSEPPFLVDEEESARVCGLLVGALENQRWRAQMRNKVNPKKVAKVAAQIADALNSPDDAHPERGLIVFRLREERSLWLVVNVTKDEENDGVFLVRGEDSSTVDIFNMAGDDNQKMLYYPLHLLVVAVRRWLAGGQPRRTVLTGGLPSRWGISTLDSLARGLLQGYLESNKMLSQQPASDPFPVCYDMNDVRAEIAFSISHQEHDTHFNFISAAAQNTENDLIS